MLGYAAGLFQDPGTLALLMVIVGIPFGFYIIKKVISLVPKR